MINQKKLKKQLSSKKQKPQSIKAYKNQNDDRKEPIMRKMTEPKFKKFIKKSKEINEKEDIVPVIMQKLLKQKQIEFQHLDNNQNVEEQDIYQQINDLDIKALKNKYRVYREISLVQGNMKLMQHVYSIKKNYLFLIYNDCIRLMDFNQHKVNIQLIYQLQDPQEKISNVQISRSQDYLLFFTQYNNKKEITIYKIILNDQKLQVTKFSKVKLMIQNSQQNENILKGLKDIKLCKNFLYILTFTNIIRINIDNQSEMIFLQLKESSEGSLRKLNNYFYTSSNLLVYLQMQQKICIVQFGKKDYHKQIKENLGSCDKIIIDQNFKILITLKNNTLTKYNLIDLIDKKEQNVMQENKMMLTFSFTVIKIIFISYQERLCVIGKDKTVICNKADLEILYSFELSDCIDVLQTSQKIMCIINFQEQELIGHIIDPKTNGSDSYSKNYSTCQNFFVGDFCRKMKFFKVAKSNKIVFINFVQSKLKIFKIKKHFEKQLCLVQNTYDTNNEIQRLFFSRDYKTIFFILSYKLIQYSIKHKRIINSYNLQQKQKQQQLLHIQNFQSLDQKYVFFGSNSQNSEQNNDINKSEYSYYFLDLSSKEKIKQYELIRQLENVKALKVFQNSRKSRAILYVTQKLDQFIVKKIDINMLTKIISDSPKKPLNIQNSIELICRLKIKKNLCLKHVYIQQFSINRFFLQLVQENIDCKVYQSTFYVFRNFKFYQQFVISHTSRNIAYNQKFTRLYFSYQQQLILLDVKTKKQQQLVKKIKKEPQYFIYNYFQNTVYFISESGLFFYDQNSNIKLKKITDDYIPYQEPSFHCQDQISPVFFDKSYNIYYISQSKQSKKNSLIKWDIQRENKVLIGDCSSYYIIDKKVENVYQIENEKNRSFLFCLPLDGTKLEAKSLIDKIFFKQNSKFQQGFKALCNKFYTQKMHTKYIKENNQTQLFIQNLHVLKESQLNYFIFFMCFLQFEQIEKTILDQNFSIQSLKKIFEFRIWLKEFVDKDCKKDKVFQYLHQKFNGNFIRFMKYLGNTFYKNLTLTNEDFQYLIKNSFKHIYIQNLISTQLKYVFKDNYDEQVIDQSQRIQRHYYNYEKEHQVLQLYKNKFGQQKFIQFTSYRLIKTNYKLQLQTGSKQFIELLDFLQKSKQSCKNQFGDIIEHKFQTIKRQMIFVLLLHFLNSLLYYWIIFYHKIRILCILLSIFVSTIAYSREVLIFQFNMDCQNLKRQHLFDTILVFLVILGFLLNHYFGQQQYKNLDYFNFFVLLFLNIRFMIDLRVFSQLRSMIAVIKQIARDIFYFIMLQGLMIYFFLILQKTADEFENVKDKNYIDYAHASIQLLFGRYFIRDKTYGLQLLIYWIFRLIFVMVISKMLIGLIQVTISQYKQNKNDIDLQETIDIMLNQNKFIYMLRKYRIFGLTLSKQDSYYYYYLEEKPDSPAKLEKTKKPEQIQENNKDDKKDELTELRNFKENIELNELKKRKQETN